MIDVKLDTHSINANGDTISTWILTYPRYIHADFMTHRVFSRNGASSRAIPISQMLKAVIKNPACPIYWGSNGKGMQDHGELGKVKSWLCKRVWMTARWFAVFFVWMLSVIGLHKQWANRILEPWLHMTVVMTTTELGNFINLRGPNGGAHPELHEIVAKMKHALSTSTPRMLYDGEWHIPLLTDEERKILVNSKNNRNSYVVVVNQYLMVATARAARISYIKHDMIKNRSDDVALHNKLLNSKHWSPFEHCAQAQSEHGWVGNFHGWVQYRKFFRGESGSFRKRDDEWTL